MWAIVLKPLGLAVMFGIAWYGKEALRVYLPNSRFKKVLFFSWKI